MDYIKASEKYCNNPNEKVLFEVTDKLIKEMTLKEKVRMMQGHAMAVTAKNFLKSGRFYNAEPYAAGGCKRLGIPEILFADGPRGIVLGKSTCFPVSMLRGAAFDENLEYINILLRDLLFIKNGFPADKIINSDLLDMLKAHSGKVSEKSIFNFALQLSKCKESQKFNSAFKLTVTNALLKIWEELHGRNSSC